jgi:sugar/nucleoside kinase (ribokinase family)
MQLVDDKTAAMVMQKTAQLSKSLSGGGSAANTINGIAKLGMNAGFIGVIGKDETGDHFRNDLVNNHITPHLFEGKAVSGMAIALVSPDSERTFATHLGCAIELSASHLNAEIFLPYRILHIEGYLVQNYELMIQAATLAKSHNLLVSIDFASFNVVEAHLEFLKDFVSKYVDIVFANEEEAHVFTGLEPEKAVKHLAKIVNIAVVKTGKTGSLVMKGEQLEKIGVIEVNSIDTTGAGDLYASGFLFGLLNNKPLTVCGKYGALLSGKVIEVMGAKMDQKRWEDIHKNLALIL